MTKPIAGKGYGSIPHMIGSRRGPTDKGINEGQQRILTEQCRRNDCIIVQEKLDGSNVSVTRVDGKILALGRAGFLATTSPYRQHRVFAAWVEKNRAMFGWIPEGWRVVGEWMYQAHGTIYTGLSAPFYAFDVFTAENKRLPYGEFLRSIPQEIPRPDVFAWEGHSMPLERIMPSLLARRPEAEGLVYRAERNGAVDFLAKYVRPEKVDGCYLPEKTGAAPVLHFTDDQLGVEVP